MSFIPKDKFNLTDLNTGLQTTVTINPTKGTVVKRLILAFAPMAVFGLISAVIAAADEADRKNLTEDTDSVYPQYN